MNTEKIIYNRFIKPFVGKTSRNIGCELEFPLINSAGGNIDVPFVSSISEHFEKIGFVCVLRGIGGEKLFMENKSGDCVSFDNSYNNFEFSMHFGSNLTEQYKRFKEYFNYASGMSIKDYMDSTYNTSNVFSNRVFTNEETKKYEFLPDIFVSCVKDALNNYPHYGPDFYNETKICGQKYGSVDDYGRGLYQNENDKIKDSSTGCYDLRISIECPK